MRRKMSPLKLLKGGFKFIKGYVKNRGLQKRTIYAWYYKYGKIRQNVIFYESFAGRGLLCNPYALFLEAMETEELKDYVHVWAIEDKNERKRLKKEYKGRKKVRFVKQEGVFYLRALATAKFLINNSTFPTFYTKKDGQVYVNTWHGIPFKTLGYDMPNGKTEVSNTVRNFIAADYVLAANAFMTQMYTEAYKLKEVFNGKIVEEGYPRLDILFRFSREEICEKLNSFGVKIDPKKKIILYAPTWKGTNFSNPEISVEAYVEFKKQLEARIDTSEYQILIKVHQKVFQMAGEQMKEPFYVPAWIDANEILAVTDILISDFSSIFYDYLATGRPVLFYIEDLHTYEEQRGMYDTLDTLPGPNTDNVEKLAEYIAKIDQIQEEWKGRYTAARTYANAKSEGEISKKILEIVFFGKEQEYCTQRVINTKKKLFISRGQMLTNGITTSLLNLLNQIDYDRYDVTLMIAKCTNDRNSGLIDQINSNVRVMYRQSTFNMTFVEMVLHKLRTKLRSKNVIQDVYKREWRRCYADISFDCLIDFEGYNYFFDLLMIQNAETPKIIWMHNDMLAEREIRFEWLMRIFKLYRHFDRLVACGEEIMKVNREKMAGKYAEYDQFFYAKNTIDFERVLRLSEEDELIDMEGGKFYCLSEEKVKTFAREDGIETEEVIPAEYLPILPEKNPDGTKNYRFITIGRMSPEKNHANLIRAFARFCAEIPNSCLYMLGSGRLRAETLALIEELGLEGNVFAPGNVKNPYIILKNSDCFILPSLHEGQPMVIHEARCLQKPVIVSNFSSVKGCLIENGQFITGTEEEEIYQALKAYVNKEVPDNYQFDPDAYNKEAMEEFYEAVIFDKRTNC